MKSFKQFIKNIQKNLTEEVHQDIMNIVKRPTGLSTKPQEIAQKTEELRSKGINPGHIPRRSEEGTSRGVLIHNSGHEVNVDGRKTTVYSALKYVKGADEDEHHDGPKSLGTMQNEHENGKEEMNNKYRVLTHDGKGNYTTNKNGIFPPLFDHDKENHQWSNVGLATTVNSRDFDRLAGISHDKVMELLKRSWDKGRGTYFPSKSKTYEDSLDEISNNHPLVRTLIQHQEETGTAPHDFVQLDNWGVHTHPVSGEKQLVIRDHGQSDEVDSAYKKSNRRAQLKS